MTKTRSIRFRKRRRGGRKTLKRRGGRRRSRVRKRRGGKVKSRVSKRGGSRRRRGGLCAPGGTNCCAGLHWDGGGTGRVQVPPGADCPAGYQCC